MKSITVGSSAKVEEEAVTSTTAVIEKNTAVKTTSAPAAMKAEKETISTITTVGERKYQKK